MSAKFLAFGIDASTICADLLEAGAILFLVFMGLQD